MKVTKVSRILKIHNQAKYKSHRLISVHQKNLNLLRTHRLFLTYLLEVLILTLRRLKNPKLIRLKKSGKNSNQNVFHHHWFNFYTKRVRVAVTIRFLKRTTKRSFRVKRGQRSLKKGLHSLLSQLTGKPNGRFSGLRK